MRNICFIRLRFIKQFKKKNLWAISNVIIVPLFQIKVCECVCAELDTTNSNCVEKFAQKYNRKIQMLHQCISHQLLQKNINWRKKVREFYSSFNIYLEMVFNIEFKNFLAFNSSSCCALCTLIKTQIDSSREIVSWIHIVIFEGKSI